MKKGEKRKQELLQIAYTMFVQNGYENTSVDDIIAEAGIAKGTYYYYFESKEQTLEEVIGMMIDREIESARQILGSDFSPVHKIVGIISAVRPAEDEGAIEGALMRPENFLMHNKIRAQLTDRVVPLLSEAVDEGVRSGIFDCDNIPERVRMLLNISNDVFDEGNYTGRDIEVFIDLAEKLLGAKTGTMGFLRDLIKRGEDR